MQLGNYNLCLIDHNRWIRKCGNNKKETNIISVRSDHGGEFENSFFEQFSNDSRISHNFTCPRIPQQNGVVERKK